MKCYRIASFFLLSSQLQFAVGLQLKCGSSVSSLTAAAPPQSGSPAACPGPRRGSAGLVLAARAAAAGRPHDLCRALTHYAAETARGAQRDRYRVASHTHTIKHLKQSSSTLVDTYQSIYCPFM